jgi:hypothetical protein
MPNNSQSDKLPGPAVGLIAAGSSTARSKTSFPKPGPLLNKPTLRAKQPSPSVVNVVTEIYDIYDSLRRLQPPQVKRKATGAIRVADCVHAWGELFNFEAGISPTPKLTMLFDIAKGGRNKCPLE